VTAAAWRGQYGHYAGGVTRLLGLRVVRRDGRDVAARQAIVRTLAFPPSFLLGEAGFAGILLGRERRALHDLIAGTAVVYARGGRAASH
jgi:uncharacterized RDD family membrane protein YckC